MSRDQGGREKERKEGHRSVMGERGREEGVCREGWDRVGKGGIGRTP